MLAVTERHVVLGGDDPEPGSLAWAVQLRDELRSALQSARFNQDLARGIYNQLREGGGWEQLRSTRGVPFRSFDHFCSDANGFGIKRAALEDKLGVQPLAKHGTNQHSRGLDDVKSSTGSGNASSYLIARLKRDAPEIADRLIAGEFPSVRAAARAAGMKVDTPAPVLAHRAWKRMTPDERRQFYATHSVEN